MTVATVSILVTFDSKHDEAQFVSGVMDNTGVKPCIIDLKTSRTGM
ncbi:MAG: hypothetical protein VW802_03405 [Rhodospirillaceae bacterium]|jgi:uncharacterized protein (UPF0261 family)